MNSKIWSLCFLFLSLLLCVCAIFLTGTIDPYFHYHAPLDTLTYPITNERYQNYGIAEHFSYDTLITGSSMTQNFRASECDALFDAQTVKLPLSGGTFLEFSQLIHHAARSNPDLKRVFWGLDCWLLFESADAMRSGEEFPTYLYDDNLFNDTAYTLNKHILLQGTLSVLDHTYQGKPTTSFDEYTFWGHQAVFSKDNVLSAYARPQKTEPPSAAPFFLENARETVTQNLIPLVSQYPNIEFYFFFTPASILNMDSLNQESLLRYQFEACSIASDLLLEWENVHLFSFLDDYKTITNLDNYFDTIHYHDGINSLMLLEMASGHSLLTKDTYLTYWQNVCAYYEAYDYDALFDS